MSNHQWNPTFPYAGAPPSYPSNQQQQQQQNGYAQQQHHYLQGNVPQYPSGYPINTQPPATPNQYQQMYSSPHSYSNSQALNAPAQYNPSLYLSQVQNYPATASYPTSTIPPPPPPPKQNKSKEPAQTYHCDACNVSFPNVKSYTSHTKAHIQCSKCSFQGSKKVVSAHYQSTHGQYAGRGLKTVQIQVPGSRQAQKFKICVGDHPDDIQKWIEERKKRFPSRANIEKKMMKNKRGRSEGAVVDTGSDSPNKKTCLEQPKEKVVEEEKVIPASSISTLIAGYGSSSDEEDIKKQETKELVCETIGESNIVSTETPPNDVDTKSNFKTKQCRYFLRNGTCKNGDNCTYIHDIEKHEEYKANADIRKERQSKRDRARNEAKKEMDILTTGRSQQNNRTKNNAAAGQTLLRKLLQNDIRRERTLTLQLLRYIVDCNYLQKQRHAKVE